MKPTKTMMFEDWKNNPWYVCACSCGCDVHNTTIEFEQDEECPETIYLNFHKKIAWDSYWGDQTVFYRLWARVKVAIKIIFAGRVELEESFVVTGLDHIDGFIEALQDGRNRMIPNNSLHPAGQNDAPGDSLKVLMTNGQLIDMLINHAKEYAPGAIKSVTRNNHMNSLSQDMVINRDIADALIVDFVNFIGAKHCMDVGLYTKDLK